MKRIRTPAQMEAARQNIKKAQAHNRGHHHRSAAQHAASLRALAAAHRKAHGHHRHESAAQRAAAVASLHKARLAEHGRARTAKQHAAALHNLAKAHGLHHTARQHAASLANLAKARRWRFGR